MRLKNGHQSVYTVECWCEASNLSEASSIQQNVSKRAGSIWSSDESDVPEDELRWNGKDILSM